MHHSLRDFFSRLDKPLPPYPQADVFYDRSGHFVDYSWWHHKNVDLNHLSNFMITYEEAYYAADDTLTWQNPLDFIHDAKNSTGKDTITLVLVDQNFYKLKSDALTTDKYFIIDDDEYLVDNYKLIFIGGPNDDEYDPANYVIDYTQPGHVNDQKWDNPNDEMPYEKNNIFILAPTSHKAQFTDVVFEINVDFFKVDSYNQMYYNNNMFWADFGDGSGWQWIDLNNGPQYIQVQYPNAGEFVIHGAISEPMPSDADKTASGIDDIESLKMHKSYIVVNSSRARIFPDEILTNLNSGISGDIEVGVYEPCFGAYVDPSEIKHLIYIEGFDPLNQVSHSVMYNHMFDCGVADLRNHGYKILTVNFLNNSQEMENNADALITLIDYLKCNAYVNPSTENVMEQFVIIGESMGGVIARYALRKMEFSHNSSCFPELMHNTRLYISYDSPQQGAYVPIAAQHAAGNVHTYSNFLAANDLDDMIDGLNILYSPAATQLLKVHVDTKYQPFTTNLQWPFAVWNTLNDIDDRVYTEHSARTDFMQNLTGMGNKGYPEFCKKYAISLGLMDGGQQTIADNTELMREADLYSNLNGALNINVLGITINILAVDLSLRTLDGSLINPKPAYEFGIGRNRWRPVIVKTYITRPFRIKLPWTQPITVFKGIWYPSGLTAQQVFSSAISNEQYHTGMYCWDAAPGGYYDIGILDLEGSLGALANVVNSSSINDIVSWAGVALTVNFGGLDKFAFVPTNSALDYNNANPEHNILAQATGIKMSNTPFDVISGRGSHPGYPNTNYLDQNFSWNGEHPYETMQNYLVDEDNELLMNGRPQLMLNREIGEDKIYLENWVINRPAQVTVNGEMVAGLGPNPYYEYPSIPAQFLVDWYEPLSNTNRQYSKATFSHTSNYTFSKQTPLTILNNYVSPDFVIFKYHDQEFTDNGVNGSYILESMPNVYSCDVVFDLLGEVPEYKSVVTEFWEEEKSDEFENILLYPNPARTYIRISIPIELEQEIQFSIFDINGKEQFHSKAKVNEELFIDVSTLKSGMYFIRASSPEIHFTKKLTIN